MNPSVARVSPQYSPPATARSQLTSNVICRMSAGIEVLPPTPRVGRLPAGRPRRDRRQCNFLSWHVQALMPGYRIRPLFCHEVGDVLAVEQPLLGVPGQDFAPEPKLDRPTFDRSTHHGRFG